jgi:hypothetical protein
MSREAENDDGRTVIFLDIDGVLNDAEPIQALPTRQSQWARLLDPERVSRLNDIIDATGAEVVLSSSWRQVHSLDDMQELLETRGFEGRLVDETPIVDKTRGEQIQAWLAMHRGEVERYIAIDDSPFMEPLAEENRVKTSGRRGGITESERDEAIQKLQEQ